MLFIRPPLSLADYHQKGGLPLCQNGGTLLIINAGVPAAGGERGSSIWQAPILR